MLIETVSKSSFFLLRDKIEKEIAKSILSFGEKNKLRDACEYALLSGGKRIRPIIVLMVADALGFNLNVSPAALAVEFLHTASLIADDLPCMDNDDERREKPSVHKAYGESVALLASYSLIFAGYEKIHENGAVMKKTTPPFSEIAEHVCCVALEHSSRLAGILGATTGQFLDLNPPGQSFETARDVIYKKTVTLFEISFLLGWVFGGGMISRIAQVKKCAYHFGMAFQIADDLGDVAQDEKGQKEINIARVLGKKRAVDLFQKEMASFEEELTSLTLLTPSFEKMVDLMRKQADRYK